MNYKRFDQDVLVVGAGFAGAIAAIVAAQQGASVAICSEEEIFSGSSFCTGAWGFGLMGPENEEDTENFSQWIEKIGLGMTRPELVRTVTGSVLHEVGSLKDLGLELQEPATKNTDKEYIPCFDYKTRSWFIFQKKQVKEALSARMDELGVMRLPSTEILELLKSDGRVCGAFAIKNGEPVILGAKSVILASGGLAPLFKYRCGNDSLSVMGQYLALNAGARLTNLEFMQIIPGFISPCFKTLCNERAFKFSHFFDPVTGENIMRSDEGIDWEAALQNRSTHGPFSTRLPSHVVDLRIFEYFLKDRRGVRMEYNPEIYRRPSEFSAYYFDWLKREKGLTPDDAVCIGNFYHASNGGIVIDSKARTDVEGLYACGEATTGMHGADRIGGMSLANCLVFGSIAAREAAASARERKQAGHFDGFEDMLQCADHTEEMNERIQELSFENMMLRREEQGLLAALKELEQIDCQLEAEARPFAADRPGDIEKLRKTMQTRSMVCMAHCLASAIEKRKESRGSHYRVDYPNMDMSLARRIIEYREGEEIKVTFV